MDEADVIILHAFSSFFKTVDHYLIFLVCFFLSHPSINGLLVKTGNHFAQFFNFDFFFKKFGASQLGFLSFSPADRLLTAGWRLPAVVARVQPLQRPLTPLAN